MPFRPFGGIGEWLSVLSDLFQVGLWSGWGNNECWMSGRCTSRNETNGWNASSENKNASGNYVRINNGSFSSILRGKSRVSTSRVRKPCKASSKSRLIASTTIHAVVVDREVRGSSSEFALLNVIRRFHLFNICLVTGSSKSSSETPPFEEEALYLHIRSFFQFQVPTCRRRTITPRDRTPRSSLALWEKGNPKGSWATGLLSRRQVPSRRVVGQKEGGYVPFAVMRMRTEVIWYAACVVTNENSRSETPFQFLTKTSPAPPFVSRTRLWERINRNEST